MGNSEAVIFLVFIVAVRYSPSDLKRHINCTAEKREQRGKFQNAHGSYPPFPPLSVGGARISKKIALPCTQVPVRDSLQQRRPLPAAETGRSCWGRGQQDASAARARSGCWVPQPVLCLWSAPCRQRRHLYDTIFRLKVQELSSLNFCRPALDFFCAPCYNHL